MRFYNKLANEVYYDAQTTPEVNAEFCTRYVKFLVLLTYNTLYNVVDKILSWGFSGF